MKIDILYVLNTMDYSCLLIRINGELIEKIVCMSEKLTTKRLHITLFLESYHTPKLYTLLILCNHSLLPQLSFPIHFTLHLQPNPRRKIYIHHFHRIPQNSSKMIVIPSTFAFVT